MNEDDPLFDAMEPANPETHPRAKALNRPRKQRDGWRLPKKVRETVTTPQLEATPEPNEPPAETPFERNMTAMMELMRQQSDELAKIRQDISMVDQKAEMAKGAAEETANKRVAELTAGIGPAIQKGVDIALNEKISQARAQAEAQVQAQAQPQPQVAPEQTRGQPNSPSGIGVMLEYVAQLAANKIMKEMGGAPGGGMGGGMVGQFNQMFQMMEGMYKLSALANAPMLTGWNMATNALAASVKAGMTPEQSVIGLQTTAERMAQNMRLGGNGNEKPGA